MRAKVEDAKELSRLVKIVWPEHKLDELTKIMEEYIANEEAAVFFEKKNKEYVGAAICALRHDYVEGCETSPVGYLEGVAVDENVRGTGVAKALVAECEEWARQMGCSEFASDCELSNTTSLNFHLAVGFAEENRLICFKKML